MNIKYFIFGLLWISFSLHAQVQVINESEQQTLHYLVTLNPKEYETPKEIVDILDPLIKQSKQLNWNNVYLEASTLKAESLIKLEQIIDAERLLSEIIPIAKEFNDPIILVRLSICELNVLERRGYTHELNNKYRSLLSQADNIKDDKTLGKVYLSAGRIKSRLTDYSEALNSLKRAYDIAEKLNDIYLLDQVIGELGTTNIRMKNYEEGIVYYLKSLNISKKNNAKYDQSVILYNLGKAYLLNNDFLLSQQMYENSIEINIELNDEIGLMWSKRGLADLALKQKKWNKAINLYHEAIEFFSEIDDKISEFVSLNGQAEAYIAIKDANNAQISLDSSKRLLNTFPTSENILRYQELLYRLEILKGNYKSATEIIIKNVEIIKKAHLLKKKQDVERQRIHFDSQLKDTENRLLMEKNELQKFKIEQQQKLEYLWYLIISVGSISLVIVMFMLYKQIQLRDRFKKMALRDHLTRSPNRRAILEYANHCLDNSMSKGNSLTIGLVDLDNFKQFNDTYGHDIGDNVLIAFSKACKNSMRDDYDYGKYGRYGGEEWLIVLPNSSKVTAQEIFNRIKENFSQLHIEGLAENHKVTFSVGVESFDKNTDQSVASIISKADKKLYIAKDNGKDQIVF
ncbi:tetratricopeptide repeat-containing diguanylate cyclase [Pseudocolwellia sp. HL-MZ19]|uniref:tetratricopeptide repeat-containing diguanylate cyclase n=1 Tax=Pseudocolwellia sp. HL-MZ19 TaxID=3400846 RepID=UPI003CF7EFAC